MMTFEEWVQTRQDARQWSEDELACAEIAWREASKVMHAHWDLANTANKNRIANLEREISWLDHHIHNLENGGAK